MPLTDVACRNAICPAGKPRERTPTAWDVPRVMPTAASTGGEVPLPAEGKTPGARCLPGGHARGGPPGSGQGARASQ